ncbi:MAG TPA: wax ester/triacylglycerol synthase family O-acyltransferase [Candidatus Dormibacteraeota bacterium]|nr:wax ester/triacylglycerol synthase family O-acyltransferase [Candidatus Dormibacteraeota bacterium]
MTDATFYEPLSARDAWFVYAERRDVPLDIGTVYVFEGGSRVPGGRGAAGIEETIAERLHLFPRYRQKLHRIALNIGHPVWVDDPDFDLGFHIRHEVLAAPATGASARAAVARILSRPVARNRPLWEMVVLHGLPGGRLMIVNRVHHAMVDGIAHRDIMTTLFDDSPEGSGVPPPADPWRPRRAPGDLSLVWRQLTGRLVDREARSPGPLTGFVLWLVAWRGFLQLGRSTLTPRPRLFFNRRLGPRRTGRGLKVPLADFRALKQRFGCTINDAVLAVVADGLHRWLTARGERVPEQVRVFVPVSLRVPGVRDEAGNRISGMVFDLPTGAMSMEERLGRVHRTTGDLKRSKQALAADKLAGLADWAPPTLLVLAGRVMATPQAGANMNVTNVPGPQQPLYTGGAQLLEIWPFAPLYPSMAVGLAIVSYNGDVFFGLGADPSVVDDVEAFAGHLRAAAESCLALLRSAE